MVIANVTVNPLGTYQQPQSLKRKRIDDFFSPTGRAPGHGHSGVVASPVGCDVGKCAIARVENSSKSLVPGLDVRLGFVTREEEAELLRFLDDESKCTWRTDLRRRCMHFGGTYCLFTPPSKSSGTTNNAAPSKHVTLSSPSATRSTEPKPEIIQAPPMPTEFDWLLDRFVTAGIFEEGKRPQFCIVNEYTGSQGISAHVENFSFAEPVVGLSLLSPVHMRFHEMTRPDGGSVRSGKAATAPKTGKREDVLLPGRSLCIMRGEARWKWQHEICRVKKGRVGSQGACWKRVSLTFRYKPLD